MSKTSTISNWNRYPQVDASVKYFRTQDELRELLKTTPQLIARGAGLSYGDASLASVIFSTLHFNKILWFDRKNGIVKCEAGVTLDELLQVIVPAGWFLPVTPGTKFITLGGAVAADVHGKNHHMEGSLCRYVNKLDLMLAQGEIISCSPTEHEEIFNQTCGGMGLSGMILQIELRLKKIYTAFIKQKNIIANNLDELVRLLKRNNSSTYSVAWIDCVASGKKLGRSVLMLGEHAGVHELPQQFRANGSLPTHGSPKLKLPFDLPSFVLNNYSVGLFNHLYYYLHLLAKKEFLVHYDKFFYPLDFIKGWNRLYGKKGFLQYQFVLPLDRGDQGLTEIIKKISASRLASFLGVLKLLGQSDHPLSFAMDGYTLALDFPISNQLFPLLDQLDEIVVANGGRIYLVKDARMKMETFHKCYKRQAHFRDSLAKRTGEHKFESLLSKRLAIL